ncbi:MAG: AMP-binding protein [Planctomycetes bacterium]|nr:AMP-binding protein [Planctomycetota bacterium]
MKPLPVATIVETLSYRAKSTPDGVAYAFDSEPLSYGQLHADVERIARGLIHADLHRGDRCAVLLPTGLQFVRAFYAVQAAGAIPLAINPELLPPFLLNRLEAAQCRFAVVPQSRREAFSPHKSISFQTIEDLMLSPFGRASLPKPEPDEGALLAATSGTSGEHRTALLLHRNLMASVRSSAERLLVGPDDVLVNWAPLYHGLGLMRFLLGGLYFGCPVHLVAPTLLNLRRWLETMGRVRATITGAPDFGFRMAAELVNPDGLDLHSLRYAMNSGEPIRLTTIEKFEQKFGVPGVIRPGYGLSEANGVSNLAPGEPLRTDAAGNVSCGRAADGLRLEIVNEADQPQPPGVAGEIRLSGEQVFAGYCDDDKATREKLRDGWLYTGDIGCLDADGHLYIQGRKRALIKRAGAMIVPRDIEEPAEQIAQVLVAGAIGVDRSSLGIEDLVVVVEAAADSIGSETGRNAIIRAVSASILESRGLSPNEVLIVPPGTIPRTPNGKLRHEELKRMYLNGNLHQVH